MGKRSKRKKKPRGPAPIVCPTPGCGAEFDRVNVAMMVASCDLAAILGGYVAPPVLLICADCKQHSTPYSPDGGLTLAARHLTPNELFRAEVEAGPLLRQGESGELGGCIGVLPVPRGDG